MAYWACLPSACGSDYVKRFSIALVSVVGLGCVTPQPATDLANTITGPTTIETPPPTTGSPPATVTVAYVQDMQPIFQTDCVPCHSGSRPDGGYSMSTYAQVMRAVAPGNAKSALVVVTQKNASMYRYWTGDAAGKAARVRTWVVDNGAAERR